jgi:hypothetical protein
MSVLANCQPLEHQNLRKLANAGAHRASKHPPHQGYSELTPREQKTLAQFFRKKNKEPEAVVFFVIGLLRLLCT